VLDAELVHQARREDTTGERSTEDGSEFSVKTADAHVFKLEVRREDGAVPSMLRSPFSVYSLLRRIFEFHAASGVLDPEDLGALHDDTGLAFGPVQGGNGSDGRLELMSAIVEDKRLEWGDREGRESLKN
jgi:hypothetical protein